MVQELSIADVDTNLRAIVTQLQDADIDVLLTGAFGFYPQLNGGTGYAAAEDRDSFEALFPSIASDLGVELLSDSAGSDKFVGGERIAGTPDTIEGGVLDSDDQSLQAGTPPDGAHPNAAGIDFIVPRIVPQVVELGAAAGVINDSFGLADGSIELWFTPETIGGDQMLSKNAGGNVAGDIEILLDGNTVLAAIQNGTDTFPVTGGTVAAGENVHVVLTFGAGGLELFVDGASVASDAGFTGGLVGNVQELALGARVNGEVAFDGVIDEVAIYDRALTAGEIGRLFDAGEQGDTLIGTAAADTLIGGSDAEDLRGAGGDDIINGNGGDDTLRGGGGEDIARGGQGDDRFLGGGGADVLLGGPDNDTLRGMGGHDRIVGGGGNDLLQVEGGRDTLSGTGGADELLGGRARDSLSGGGGDDLLNGGPGRDQLNGGPDSDTFEIDRIGHGPDRIFDFEDGVGGDVLDLSAVLDFGENDNLDDFVRLDPVNNNANVEVDPNGGGDDFTTVFRLIGGADLDINALINDGNIDLGTPTS
jgi:Ca2+-binding RTX toxin-like protein